MARGFKQTVLFISRAYYHGGDGLEDLGLRIFYSMEEYQRQATEEGWDQRESHKSSWSVRPREISCRIPSNKFWKIAEQALSIEDIFIPLEEAATINKLHW
jgi:hypothetical protein